MKKNEFKEMFMKLVESQELEPETARILFIKIVKILYRENIGADHMREI